MTTPAPKTFPCEIGDDDSLTIADAEDGEIGIGIKEEDGRASAILSTASARALRDWLTAWLESRS